MKQIKLNGVTMDAEEAKKIIADLQAQIDAPEEPEFWKGQILVDGAGKLFQFQQLTDDGLSFFDTTGAWHTAKYCRPLQDPLILQFKSHTPGDPMPCDGSLMIRFLRNDGRIGIHDKAIISNWGKCGPSSIIGWMPFGGWGSEPSV